MSDTVYYKGTLLKLYNDTIPLAEKINLELSNFNIDFVANNGDDFEEALELLQEAGYEYYIHKDSLFLVQREKLDPYSVSSAYQVTEHEIKFEVVYYNGGMCFDEALEMALKDIS